MHITFLGSRDCPNTPRLRSNVEQALARLGITSFEELDQTTMNDDDIRRGYPTPTILVNGQDLYGLTAPKEALMRCRLYPNGLPGANEIYHLLLERLAGMQRA